MATEPLPVPAEPASEVSALGTHHCPGCGAEAAWHAERQALVCPYCGTVSPAQLARDGSLIEDHDVAKVLRALPDDARGWEQDRTPVRCGECNAISLFEATRAGQRCEFCGSTALVPFEHSRRAIRPESILPFGVTEPQARESLRRWLGRGGITDTVVGAYIPYWRFRSEVYVHWHAAVDYGTKDRPDWTPADAGFSVDVEGDLLPATRGIDAALLERIAPFPEGQLVPFDPGYVAGWIVEQYQIDLGAAVDRTRAELEAAAPAAYRRRCIDEIPVRRYMGLVVTATSAVKAFRHTLLPVWLLRYRAGGVSYSAVINGATGAIAGERPASHTLAIAVAGGLVLLAAAAILWVTR